MRLSLRSLFVLTTLGLATAAAANLAAAGQPPPHTDAVPTPAHPAHGFVQIIGEALTEVTLRADQASAVEALGAQIEPLQIKVDDAENALLLVLADQVMTGHVDRDALEPLVTAYATARQDVSGELRAALEKLHDTLDASQREDLADSIESRVHRFRLALMAGEQLDDLAEQLQLTDAQKQSIRDGLTELAPSLEHERAVIHQALEGFRGETFAIEEYLPQAKVPEMARQRAERIIDLTAATVDLLDATQRAKLAERIREAALARGDEIPEPAAPAQHAQVRSDESVGEVGEPLWAAGRVRRGPFGGVRGGVVVGGARGYAYRRAAAFPFAAGWGYGW